VFSGLLVTRPYDYCNSLLAGVAGVYLQRLQSVQNAAARGLRGSSSRPVLDSLHWLPVRQRIIYKTAVLVWKCLHDAAPRYLADLCVPAHSVHGRQQLRSTASGTLLVPRTRTVIITWLTGYYYGTCRRTSAVSPSTDHERGTVCQLNSEHQI